MKKPFNTKQSITILVVFLIFVCLGLQAKYIPYIPDVQAQDIAPVVSPSPISEVSNIKVSEVITTEYKPAETPEEYIKEVFGEHADKAFLLLKGNGEKGSCAENRQLDPKAVNDNRTWGGVGRDVNIFQVNDVYHPVVELNLENDWKANIRYAKKMFDNDGETFAKRWTCGKYYNKLGYTI